MKILSRFFWDAVSFYGIVQGLGLGVCIVLFKITGSDDAFGMFGSASNLFSHGFDLTWIPTFVLTVVTVIYNMLIDSRKHYLRWLLIGQTAVIIITIVITSFAMNSIDLLKMNQGGLFSPQVLSMFIASLVATHSGALFLWYLHKEVDTPE